MVLWLYVLYTTVQSYRFALLDDCQVMLLSSLFAAKLLNDGLTCLCLSIPGVVVMSFMCKTLSTYTSQELPTSHYIRVLHTNESLIYHMICLVVWVVLNLDSCIPSTHMSRGYTFMQVWDSHSFYVRMVDTIDITTCTCEHRKSGISFVYTRSSTIMDSICWL